MNTHIILKAALLLVLTLIALPANAATQVYNLADGTASTAGDYSGGAQVFDLSAETNSTQNTVVVTASVNEGVESDGKAAQVRWQLAVNNGSTTVNYNLNDTLITVDGPNAIITGSLNITMTAASQTITPTLEFSAAGTTSVSLSSVVMTISTFDQTDIESTLSTLTTSVSSLTTTVSGQSTTLTDLSTKLAELQTQLDSLNTSGSTTGSATSDQITVLQAEVSKLNEAIQDNDPYKLENIGLNLGLSLGTNLIGNTLNSALINPALKGSGSKSLNSLPPPAYESADPRPGYYQ